MEYFMRAEEVQNKIAGIPREQVKAVLRDAFAGLASGQSIQPPQSVVLLPEDAGDCIIYPAALWRSKLIGVKASPYLTGLAKLGKYPATAFTMLISGENGEPVLVCDSLALTTIRTAATTALALDYLTPASAQTLAVIGAGKIGLAHLDFISRQHPWQEIRLYALDLQDENDPRFHSKKMEIEALGMRFQLAGSARQAVAEADVVALCTSSGKPVVETGWLKDDAVVTSISTNAPRAHEIPPQDLAQYRVFCDYRRTAPLAAGEMVIAREAYGWRDDLIIADLPELVTGKYSLPPMAGKRSFFRSIGLGIEDLAIASLLV